MELLLLLCCSCLSGFSRSSLASGSRSLTLSLLLLLLCCSRRLSGMRDWSHLLKESWSSRTSLLLLLLLLLLLSVPLFEAA
jgi:hypothetical protein